jgi:uncharacterized protein YerC
MKRTNTNVKIIAAALRRSTKTKVLEDFLSDLLTKDEQEYLAQRISIAKELTSGTSVDKTARKIKTSTSTVSDVMQIIKHGTDGYKSVSMQ